MTRRLAFVVAGALVVLGGAAAIQQPVLAKSETATPPSGPPGTQVTISGLETCEDGTATFDSESTPGGRYTTSGVATLTVPTGAAVGQHWIYLSCRNGGTTRIGAASFTVSESTAIRAQPDFTG
jgi:hypothetical protein